VLGAAEADALAAELDGGARIVRRIGVDANPSLRTESAQPISVPNSPDNSGSIIGIRPASTWPSEPSMVMTSPVLKVREPMLMVPRP
jgi:hypothetical protein